MFRICWQPIVFVDAMGCCLRGMAVAKIDRILLEARVFSENIHNIIVNFHDFVDFAI